MATVIAGVWSGSAGCIDISATLLSSVNSADLPALEASKRRRPEPRRRACLLRRGQKSVVAACRCSAVCVAHLSMLPFAHSLLAAFCPCPLTPIRLPVGKISILRRIVLPCQALTSYRACAASSAVSPLVPSRTLVVSVVCAQRPAI